MTISRKTRVTVSWIAGAIALAVSMGILYSVMQPSSPDSYNAFRDNPVAMRIMFVIPVAVIILANIQKKETT